MVRHGAGSAREGTRTGRERWQMGGKAEKGQIAGLAVRQKAARVLCGVLGGKVFRPLAPDDLAGGADRALANRLVTLALRRHGHLNLLMGRLLKRGVPARSGLFEALLRIGLVQLLFMDRADQHATVHLCVEAAKRDRRAGRYAGVLNGVLREAQRHPEMVDELGMAELFPPWLREKWRRVYGADMLDAFGRELLAGAALDIVCPPEGRSQTLNGCGPVPGGRDGQMPGGQGEVPTRAPKEARPLLGAVLRVERQSAPVAQMLGFAEGKWWVQDVAASLAAPLFRLKEGARVLDMCAAPGGKTAQLAHRGFAVTALDRSEDRLQRLRENMDRLHLDVRVETGDAREFSDAEGFDGVLVDAPCTATGTFRRHPEVLWHRTQQDVSSRVELQRAILASAVRNLKRGGELILCVCSLQKEEGEAQAEWVMHTFEQLVPCPIGSDDIGGIAGA
ncbi:MAG TPA: methyltransferase domain-containing protein, partial [Devosia sp.]|nr:methyltransferase domain-containing protein [Devosia sp.]